MAYILETSTLTEVLRDTMCENLPDKVKDNSVIWSRAIVKVKKANGKGGFGVAINDGFGKPLIKKVYGSPSQIIKVLAIYPIIMLGEKDVPILPSMEEKAKFLIDKGYAKHFIKDIYEQNDRDTMQRYIYQYIIKELNKGIAKELANKVIVDNTSAIRIDKEPTLFDDSQEDFYFRKPAAENSEPEPIPNEEPEPAEEPYTTNINSENHEEKPKKRGRKKKS